MQCGQNAEILVLSREGCYWRTFSAHACNFGHDK